MLNIKDTLLQLENLSEKFLQSKDKQALKKSCEGIKNKYDSKRLYLAVVGEFSSGKSTFINALVGQRLLKEAVFPTTACATFIEHQGKELVVAVLFNDGKKYAVKSNMLEKVNLYLQQRYHQEVANIHRLIELLTSDTTIAKDVKALMIDVPDAKFPPNIVLIDTPGFNPGALETNNHFEITSDVVENISDMAIVLTSAQQAMSASLQHFLLEHVRRCLHRCIFVVSKIDLIAAEERSDVLDFTRHEITNRLGVSTPFLYGVSSVTMLPVKNIPAIIADQWNLLKRGFETFESNVWRLLEQKRELVVSEHVLNLINTLMNSCKQNIEKVDAELTDEERLLSETKVESIQKVTDKMVNNAIVNFGIVAQQIRTELVNSYLQCRAQALNEAKTSISTLFSEEDNIYSTKFENEATTKVNDVVRDVTTDWIQEHTVQINKKIQKAVSTELNTMTKTFKSHYNKFPSLKGQLEEFPINISSITYSEVSITGIQAANQGLNEQENKYSLGGAAGGAAIGFAFGGPVGAVVGAAVGWFVGLIKGDKSLEKLDNFQTQSAQAIRDYFDSGKKGIVSDFDSVCLKIKKAFSDYGKLHVSTYGDRVSELINVQEKQALNLKNKRNELHNAIDTLSKWQVEIEGELVMLKQK